MEPVLPVVPMQLEPSDGIHLAAAGDPLEQSGGDLLDVAQSTDDNGAEPAEPAEDLGDDEQEKEEEEDDDDDDDDDGEEEEQEEQEDYEAVRRRNIERNNAKLLELQLFGLSAMAPKGITPRRKRSPAVPVAPSRASGRDRKPSQAILRAEESERAHEKWLDQEKQDKDAQRAAKNAQRAAKKRKRTTSGGGGGGRGGGEKRKCEDCLVKAPSFGLSSERKRRWCIECATQHEGAVLLKTRTPCEDCKLVDPSFGLLADKKRRWCHGCAVQHKDAVCLKSSHGRPVGWSPMAASMSAANRSAAAASAAVANAAVHVPAGWNLHYPPSKSAGSSSSRAARARPRSRASVGYVPAGWSVHYPGPAAPVAPSVPPPASRSAASRSGGGGGSSPRSRPPCEECLVKDPSFGDAKERKRRWCNTCAKLHPGAVLLKKRSPCEDCLDKDPSFGLELDRKRRWCHGCALKHEGAVCLKKSGGKNGAQFGRPVQPLRGSSASLIAAAGGGPRPPADLPLPRQQQQPASAVQQESRAQTMDAEPTADTSPGQASYRANDTDGVAASAATEPPASTTPKPAVPEDGRDGKTETGTETEPEAETAPGDTDTEICMVCQAGGHEDKLLLCDSCPEACHTFCMVPALSVIPAGAWFCQKCRQLGVENSRPLTAADALEAARQWYDSKSAFARLQKLKMKPLKAFYNNPMTYSIAYTTNPPTEDSPYFVRVEYVRERQSDSSSSSSGSNSFAWRPDYFDEKGASEHPDGYTPPPPAAATAAAAAAAAAGGVHGEARSVEVTAAAAAAAAATAAAAAATPRRVGDRVRAMYHDGYTYGATILAVHKLDIGINAIGGSTAAAAAAAAAAAGGGDACSYVYTVDWDDGDQHCRRRSEDQLFTPGQAPDEEDEEHADDGEQKDHTSPVIKAAAAATAATTAAAASAPTAEQNKKQIQKHNKKQKTEQPSCVKQEPAVPAVPAAPAAATNTASNGSRPGRVRKRKAVYDPDLENSKPQWASTFP